MTARANITTALALAAAVQLIAAADAHAGGPLANCEDGVPFLWPNGGAGVTWNPDQGDLGNFTKAEADALVADSFGMWEDIATASISFQQGADLPVDVTIDNFGPFLQATAPDGLSAIVYDDTGEIFELLYGAGSGVLGFAGPEFGDPSTCTILEGLSFLNGPEFDPADFNFGFGITVHEFGHFSNLAHSQTNGAMLLSFAGFPPQASGPDPFDTFGAPTVADFIEHGLIETMYPFIFGSDFGTETPHLDDVTTMSRLYPSPGYAAATVTISGSVLAPNGTTRLSGINVIARNVDNPFLDAVSAISGDFTEALDPASSDVVGTFTFTGLTPGATYAIFVDGIVEGGFSTPPIELPAPEELWSGAGESNADPLDVFAGVSGAAGDVVSGIDIVLNTPQPGDPLPTGDDGFVELFLPFPVDFCGERYETLFVNANGHITFEAPDGTFFESALGHLTGPPRIAGLWTDLNPTGGGVVTFGESSDEFAISWQAVPEYPAEGANSFTIELQKKNWLEELFGPLLGNRFAVSYGDMTAAGGLAGFSCGGALTGGFESETDLSEERGSIGGLLGNPATFEQFVFGADSVDLEGTLRYSGVNPPLDLFDLGGGNNELARATPMFLVPFTSAFLPFATTIDPEDVDYYRFRARAGEVVAIEVVRGQMDSLLGVFNADTGALLAVDDDGGNGLLSRLVFQVEDDVNLAFAVTTFPDVEFVGAGGSAGRYTIYANRYRGELIALGDDDTLEIDLGGFEFDFQGTTYHSAFVNSNGNITFGEGDTSFSESVPALLEGAPRIAPLWNDFDPSADFILVDSDRNGADIHFVSVGEFFSDDPNYFSVSLGRRGRVSFQYGPTARRTGLAGITEGGGVTDPGPTDLGDSRLDTGGTTYETFGFTQTTGLSDFDLFFDSIRFR